MRVVRSEFGAQRGRKCAPKERADLGRRYEVACGTELHTTRAVVAEPGRVQRELHVAREVEDAVGSSDLGANHSAELGADPQRFVTRHR